MAGELARPASSDELYIARGNPVEPWRPVMTGDIFRAVQIPGLEEHPLAMVITHPCTMRGKAGALKDRLQALPVVAYNDVPLAAWPTGHFRVFPLPELDSGDASYAAKLDEIGVVETSNLSLVERVASLSERGVELLLQRFFNCFARVTVTIPTISEALASPLQEAELLEEWNERLAEPRVAAGEELGNVLASEAKEFDAFLSADGGSGRPLREGLANAAEAVGVRRSVRTEIGNREL